MNIFDILDGICFSKKKDILDNVEKEKEYSPFIVNRWISMLDPSAAKIVNDTVNRFGHVFTNQEQYKLLTEILPRYKRQKINYIKKPTKT
ncbi:MAG: hypothetical protein EBU90_02365 [Proteobacteria bacterium]|nr:hypothetical protein [Pseudomonadota bacterium]NBP13079.1 hypothetical protein [bacterium]